MSAAITPDTVDALTGEIQSAHSAKTPLEIGGGFTRRGVGRPPQTAKQISTAALSGISLYEPGALTMVAQAGTPVAEIEAALAGENQRLAFEPIDHRTLLGTTGEPTIGGVVACNLSGPRRIQAGACRDSLLGVQFVDGKGILVSNGGRVMKNVTGYDIAKLLCGSWGTLGVLTEVSLKVLPTPEYEATITLEQSSVDEAVATMAAALGSPFEVTGAAHQEGSTHLRVEGLEGQVRYRVQRLQDTILRGTTGTAVADGPASSAIWQTVRDVTAFADSGEPVWKVSVKPTDAPVVTAAIRRQLGARFVYDWGGGLIWIAVADTGAGSGVSTNGAVTDAGASVVRGAITDLGGHATLVRASEAVRAAVPVFQPEPARLARLTQLIRTKFDPAGILNPGRMAAA